MHDQIIVHKPRGAVIDPLIYAKLTKEYTGKDIYYFYRCPEKKQWFYSDFAKALDNSKNLLGVDADSVIYFNKSHYASSLENPVDINKKADDNWFITCGVGKFPFFIATNEKGPSVMFDNFIKFLDLQSLPSFLTSLCKEHNIQYAAIVNGQQVRRFGEWVEHDGIFYSDMDFYHKIEVDIKTIVRNVLAFFINPDDVKTEVKRLEGLSDLKLKQEAQKVPNLAELIAKN